MKEEEEDEDIDLFGEDDEEENEEAEKLKAERVKAYEAKKAAKPKTIAKVGGIVFIFVAQVKLMLYISLLSLWRSNLGTMRPI